jgi:hypothetical protein
VSAPPPTSPDINLACNWGIIRSRHVRAVASPSLGLDAYVSPGAPERAVHGPLRAAQPYLIIGITSYSTLGICELHVGRS